MKPLQLSLGITALLLLLAACSQEPTQQTERSAQSVFADVESRLLAANTLQVQYTARAVGAFSAEINGVLSISTDNVVTLSGNGSFGDQPVALHLLADEFRLTGGNGANTFEQTLPAELKAALILGLTRMGIMHNLARLTAAQAPDHADGGVALWVQATDFSWTDQAVSFGIVVSGERTAEASLTFDGQGLPLRRTQEVSFPGGSMQVIEEYRITVNDPTTARNLHQAVDTLSIEV